MNSDTAKNIVILFNDCINRRDIDGLFRLMTDDHVFIDSADNMISGKARCVEAWKGFFGAFPGYRNHFERFHLLGGEAVVVGRSAAQTVVRLAPHCGPRG